jgi:hypothetical protein
MSVNFKFQTFHILNVSIFEAEYQQFRHSPHAMSMSWIALFFAVIATSISALEDDGPILSDLGRERTAGSNIELLCTRYRSAALRCLAIDRVMTHHTINSLQALVLINFACLYRGLPCSSLIELTHYVGISMGCHIDPEKFLLSTIECEERRRVWAGLMTLYAAQCTFSGSLYQQHTSQDLIWPADIDDVDLMEATRFLGISGLSFSPCTVRLTEMTYLFLSCHLNRMSNRIYESLTSKSCSRHYLATLEAELHAIREQCDARYSQDCFQESIPVHHHANKKILHAQIQQQYLLLHRKALIRFLRGEINPETRESCNKCIASAHTAISIFSELLKDPKFIPYKWYTSGLGSLHAFHATIVLSVLSYHSNSTPEFDRTKEVLTDVIKMFASLSERSTFCGKAIPIIRRMMSVILSDPWLKFYLTWAVS